MIFRYQFLSIDYPGQRLSFFTFTPFTIETLGSFTDRQKANKKLPNYLYNYVNQPPLNVTLFFFRLVISRIALSFVVSLCMFFSCAGNHDLTNELQSLFQHVYSPGRSLYFFDIIWENLFQHQDISFLVIIFLLPVSRMFERVVKVGCLYCG